MLGNIQKSHMYIRGSLSCGFVFLTLAVRQVAMLWFLSAFQHVTGLA